MLHSLNNNNINNNDSILILAYAQKSPYITRITQRFVMDIGGEIDLDCSTRHSREQNVSWVKVTRDQINASIELAGSTLIVKDPKVSLITQIKQDGSQYTIHVTSYENNISLMCLLNNNLIWK